MRVTPWIRDAGERVAKTFVGGFVATYLAAGVNATPSTNRWTLLNKAGFAGVTAVASLAMSVLSKWSGSANSASLVRPADLAPPPAH